MALVRAFAPKALPTIPVALRANKKHEPLCFIVSLCEILSLVDLR
jgi:hypothetical protein